MALSDEDEGMGTLAGAIEESSKKRRIIKRDRGYDSLSTNVEVVETMYTTYLCSGDVVALMERLDNYISDRGLSLVTLDRTNSGQFYAFLSRASSFI